MKDQDAVAKKRKAKFNKKLNKFILADLICFLMKQEKATVRGLAKDVGISASVIQDIRQGDQKSMKN